MNVTDAQVIALWVCSTCASGRTVAAGARKIHPAKDKPYPCFSCVLWESTTAETLAQIRGVSAREVMSRHADDPSGNGPGAA